MTDETFKPDQGDEPELLTRIADEIVEALRKAYAVDQNAKAYDATWRKYKAQGVSWETFLAARDLARPRLGEQELHAKPEAGRVDIFLASMSFDELWELYEKLTTKLADEVAVEKAKVEELLRETDWAKATTQDLPNAIAPASDLDRPRTWVRGN